MQQRYYDPSIGRFLSTDPVTANSGTGANFNRFWYANNNPYKFTDPDGRLAGIQSDWRGDYYRDQGGERASCNFCLGDSTKPKKSPITPTERKMQASGDLRGFWRSRAKAGSGWASTALGIWAPEDTSVRLRILGKFNIFRLNAALITRDGLSSTSESRDAEISQMGQEIAGRYIIAVDNNRGFEPTLSQSNAYHFSVFSSHGLSGEAYGGTPLGYSPTGIGRYLGDAQSRFINLFPVTTYCDGCSP